MSKDSPESSVPTPPPANETPQSFAPIPMPINDLIEQDRISNVSSIGRLEHDRMSNMAANDQIYKGSTASFPMAIPTNTMQQDRSTIKETLYNTIEQDGSVYKVPIIDPVEKDSMLKEDLLLAKTKQILFKTSPQIKRSRRHRLRNFLRKRICMLNWIGDYNIHWGVHDAIAGVTLGLTIIPESIACALLAGLPARYGLCSAFIGCFIYLIFGAIDKVIIGPASLLALVSVQFTIGKPIEFAIALTFLSGVVQLIMSALELGFIFEFISTPVIKAFSSATSVLVIESQLKVLMGIEYIDAGFLSSVKNLVMRYNEANLGDLAMGLFAIIFLIGFGFLEKLSHDHSLRKWTRHICRYLSYGSNTLIVFITAIISYIWLQYNDKTPFALVENNTSGLPNFTFPALSIETEEKTYTFWEIVAELKVGIIVVPIVGVLTNISIGKLKPKGIVDCNHELATLGLCNVFGSCVQAMPTSGAFTRYAISKACGLDTPMANLYTGAIVLLALSYLSQYINYIPDATLAAILICSIYTLIDFKLPRRLWNQSKRDLGVWLVCFLVSILCGVEVGLLVSIVINVIYLLYLWAHPKIAIQIKEIDGMQYLCVTPGNGIYFPAITHLRAKVLRAATEFEFQMPVVIDCHKVNGLDYTAALGLIKLANGLQPDKTEAKHHTAEGVKGGEDNLLIIYKMEKPLQKVIDDADILVYCETEDKLKELISQEYLCRGLISLKETKGTTSSIVDVKVNVQ